jgi:hypothetical protein
MINGKYFRDENVSRRKRFAKRFCNAEEKRLFPFYSKWKFHFAKSIRLTIIATNNLEMIPNNIFQWSALAGIRSQ